MALIASLFAAAFLTCVGVALALLGAVETTVSAHDLKAAAAAHAAEAAAELSSAELRARADWAGAFTGGAPDMCAVPGLLVDGTMFPPAPWNGLPIDLHALTAQLQAQSDTVVPTGVAGPVWRVFENGPISRLEPSGTGRQPFYLVVWAAAGGDGLLLLHATALGPLGITASVETSIRPPAGGVGPMRQATRTVR